MICDFIERLVIVKFSGSERRAKICIDCPLKNGDYFTSKVVFDGIEKYDAEIRGLDEFHCTESSIAYVNSICRNSIDPKFYHLNGDSIFVDEA